MVSRERQYRAERCHGSPPFNGLQCAADGSVEVRGNGRLKRMQTGVLVCGVSRRVRRNY